MKILILSQWYPPEPMKLLSDMAETLCDMGHSVTVLTGFPNWPAGKLYPGYSIKLKACEYMGNVPIVRLPLYPDHSRSSIRRMMNFASFMASASVLGTFSAPRPDIIHVIQPPTTCFPAWVLSRVWGVPFTYEVQDMWPETLKATGMVHSEEVLSMVSSYCRWSYGKAAAIRVISPGFRADLIRKGVQPEKIHLIPNWVDTDFYSPQVPSSSLGARLHMNGRFNILYAGTIGLAQGIETILQAAELVTHLPEVQFVLAGDGMDLHRLERAASDRKLENLKFLGRLPVDMMPAIYALADVLLVHLKDDPLFRMTIPHKTLTYLSAGKPIIAAIEGDVAELVSSAKAGLTCPSGNPEGLAQAVMRLYQMPAAARQKLGENGRLTACAEYSRDGMISQIVSMFESVLSTS
jgi:colanic acid biosynthesis glycosyl transferase WcaI